jgi:hypothetical protein
MPDRRVASRRASSDPRGHRLPDDWRPSAADIAYAEEHGLDPDRVAETFRNHWHSKAGKDARKISWSATWRNWCLEDEARGRNLAGPNVLPFGPRAAPTVRAAPRERPSKIDWFLDDMAGGRA